VWDTDGSAPDPLARIFQNGALIGTTPELEDTLDPTWDYSTNPVVIESSDVVTIDLIDSDLLVDDPIFTKCAVVFARGASECTGSQATLQLSIAIE
jgi:hypothetical protein